MKISLVIVAYKNGNILLDCLNSIEKYNDLKDELEAFNISDNDLKQAIDAGYDE